MAKKGMARPDWTHTHPRSDTPPVPEIHGKAKTGKMTPDLPPRLRGGFYSAPLIDCHATPCFFLLTLRMADNIPFHPTQQLT